MNAVLFWKNLFFTEIWGHLIWLPFEGKAV